MNSRSAVAFAILVLAVTAAERPWQQIVIPTSAEVAASFQSPPAEYGMTMWWGWDGPITEEVINRDLDGFKASGVHAVTIEPGYKMDNAPYLSPAWFQMIKIAVEQARRRGMKVWLVDEGKYPSGFAGGKFVREHPELLMQALLVERVNVAVGETLTRIVSPATVGMLAVNPENGARQPIAAHDGQVAWKAPEGKWQVLFVEHRFKSSPTRSVNNAARGKDDKDALMDYLDPAATRQFLAFTHEQYSKYVGEEFGKTILGFRGDEPDYSIGGIPWTPAIFAEFQRRKGYDVQPFAASFFAPKLTAGEQRAKADYWDVWSDLFRDGFFKQQAEWCARHNLEYLVHLNHEDAMMQLARSEGDFFKDMRYVQVPGIDAIWNQIWPGKIADFPKYASSAAHVYGRPRAFTESFAAYNPAPDVEQARWVLNQQFVRGINLVEIMFTPSSAASGQFRLRGWMGSPQFPPLTAWIHRASYLLSIGRPDARIAVYHPVASMWMGDEGANKTTLTVMRQLLEHQLDFDFIDEDALASTLTLETSAATESRDPGVRSFDRPSAAGSPAAGRSLEGAAFRSASGSEYRAVIVPGATVMSRAAFDRLRAFAKSGGRVVFVGSTPSLLVSSSFLKADSPPALAWATVEASDELTARVISALPPPDLLLDHAAPAVKYLHRRWRDADLYFVFNESGERQSVEALLSGKGNGRAWDAASGGISTIPNAAVEKSGVRVPLDLAPYESKFITIGGA